LYKFRDKTLHALDDKIHVGGVFCDLAKVNHDILLSKPNFHEIQGKARQWVKYLSGTKQRVEIKSSNSNDNTFSDWGIVKHAVSQGSVLNPLLFLLYINGLSRTINSQSKPILFAADTSIVIYHPDSD
jgi:hypothetical protein